MPRERGKATAAVLCTDLVGSTALLGRLGEEGFDGFRRQHFGELRAGVTAHGGEEIKTLGDGILATFTSAADALSCAVALQQAIDRPATGDDFGVAIRIGLAVGDVAREDGDVFGAPVVLAARLTAAAAGGQILTTDLVRAVAGGRSVAACTVLGPMELKGLAEPVSVCEVEWSRPCPSPPAAEVRLLGAVDVAVAGQAIGIGSAKQRAILAALALSPGAVVAADALVDVLWGDRPPPSGPATLRSLVARLRRTLDEAGAAQHLRLFGKGAGYVLDVEPDLIDARRFEELRARARLGQDRGDGAQAAEDLEASLALWRGPALGDLASWDFATVEARRLEESRLIAIEDLAELELGLGRAEPALTRVDALVRAHPLRERAWGLLMLAAYRAGRQADALEAYLRARRILRSELGVEPTPTLRELHERILRHDPELAPEPAATFLHGTTPFPAPAATPARHDIPVALTSFVGRSAELAELAELVAAARMVTLTGTGGAGKTRLALAGASAVQSGYRDGVRVAELASVRDPALVAGAVASAIGFLPGELTAGG